MASLHAVSDDHTCDVRTTEAVDQRGAAREVDVIEGRFDPESAAMIDRARQEIKTLFYDGV